MLIANASNYNPYQNNKPQGIIMENKGLLRQNLLNAVIIANNRIVTDITTQLGEEIDTEILGEQLLSYIDTGSVFGVQFGDLWVWDSNNCPNFNDKDEPLSIQDFTSIIATEVLLILSYAKNIRNTMKVLAKEHQVSF